MPCETCHASKKNCLFLKSVRDLTPASNFKIPNPPLLRSRLVGILKVLPGPEGVGIIMSLPFSRREIHGYKMPSKNTRKFLPILFVHVFVFLLPFFFCSLFFALGTTRMYHVRKNTNKNRDDYNFYNLFFVIVLFS